MNPLRHEKAIAGVAVLALLAFTLVARPASADAHAEGVARDAMQKASADYATANYTAAVAKLKKAAQACGAKNCSSQIKGAVLRDLGTMEFRAGDKDAASKSFGDALTADQTLTLNPAYDASDVGAAWEDARAAAGLPAGQVSTKAPPGAGGTGAAGAAPPNGGGTTTGAGTGKGPGHGGAPAEPTGEQPSGDFDHDPAQEQKEDTPLPIHVEYGGSAKLTRVVLKYKGAQMREWAHLDMTHVEGGNAYEATIPCGDVMRGTMRYWVQGFDKTNEPVAATGDPKHPFFVVIRDKITSEPPHLPGRDAPKSCEETDCPPGLPGCNKHGKGGEAGGEGGGSGDTGGTEGGDDKKKKAFAGSRLWIGASFTVDFLSMPQASNVCARNPSTGTPNNSQGYYCYDPVKGADFPSQAQNGSLSPNGSGTASGTLQAGNIRALLAVDYALTPNLLAGARVGYVINAYPGNDAVKAGHAMPPIHLEARGTYLLGDAPLTKAGFAPMGFLALGAGEFDGHQSTNVRICQQNGQPASGSICQGANATPYTQQVVDVWLTDAPFFVALGAGARYQFSPRAAVTGALRLNVVIGGNGVLPTFGPEIGVLYGL